MKLSPNARISSSPSASTRRAPGTDARAILFAASPKEPSAAATNREVVIERKPKKPNGGVGATKKRVRLKPETPEQLIERLRNPQLSLHEASILLRVSRATVRRYADAGRLNCQRTPGGQRRFFLRDIENFYRQLKLKR